MFIAFFAANNKKVIVLFPCQRQERFRLQVYTDIVNCLYIIISFSIFLLGLKMTVRMKVTDQVLQTTTKLNSSQNSEQKILQNKLLSPGRYFTLIFLFSSRNSIRVCIISLSFGNW